MTNKQIGEGKSSGTLQLKENFPEIYIKVIWCNWEESWKMSNHFHESILIENELSSWTLFMFIVQFSFKIRCKNSMKHIRFSLSISKLKISNKRFKVNIVYMLSGRLAKRAPSVIILAPRRTIQLFEVGGKWTLLFPFEEP